MKPWGPKFLCGARSPKHSATWRPERMLIVANGAPERRNGTLEPHFPPWSPTALRLFALSPGILSAFGTLILFTAFIIIVIS